MGNIENLWDITNRISTKTKLKLIQKIFNMWLTIWQNQKWINKEWYVIDLFAGKGCYLNKNKKVLGSFLIFLEEINKLYNKLVNNNIKIKLFAIEKNTRNYKELENNINDFILNNNKILDIVNINLLRGDCNEKINEILPQINNNKNNPLFILIDPTGLQIKRNSLEKLLALENKKDILFNYILEGVRRTSGIVTKLVFNKSITPREIKTIKTLFEFLGEDINVIRKSRPDDIKILEDFVNSVFQTKNLNIVGYDIKYPDRNDELYYLLFVSKNPNIVKIVKDIYAYQKEKTEGPTIFGKELTKQALFEAKTHKLKYISKKSFLYQTKVEYGDWTINHISGCAHGCKFPCYAMMMAKRFGWITDYHDWRIPKIAKNSINIIKKEIKKYKNKIKFVHLCFTTDPFMYNWEEKDLFPEIKELTLNIISLLNENNIKVTTLTKGYYPEELLSMNLNPDNEYGITLISLNPKFKKDYEPYSAPYEKRIKSLYYLHENKLKTWVSIEPYPTPNIDETAENIDMLLEKIHFVDKIIFGKLNYNIKSSRFKYNEEFYKMIAQKIITFCKKNKIIYHIKEGTPLYNKNTTMLFKK